MVYFLLYFLDPEDDDFVEEIIESEDDNKSIGKRNLFPKLKLPIILILLNFSLGGVEVIEEEDEVVDEVGEVEVPTMGETCLLYTSPSPRDLSTSRMPSSA